MNPYDPAELKKRCENPLFCIVCHRNRNDIKIDKYHVCEECRKGSDKTPRRLRAVTLDNGKTYFVDERLKQLRNVNNPTDYMDW
jgi:hypothetical protein